MKSFKEFIKTPKEYEVIFNSHGSHASKYPDNEKKMDK
jgi:hypothetical protein